MWLFRRLLTISWTDHTKNAEIFRCIGTAKELLEIIKREKTAYLGRIFRKKHYISIPEFHRGS